MVVLSLMLFADLQAQDRVAALVAEYREHTRVAPRCDAEKRRDDEIVVCADRVADRRYRVPFVTINPRDSIPLRTAALLDEHRAPCGEGAFLVRCGKVGVSATLTFGAGAGSGGIQVETARKRAP